MATCSAETDRIVKLTTLADDARIALGNLADRAAGMVTPSLRLGVTGLSRSGKTVFITALIHNLVHGGRLPLFSAHAAGRIARAYLQPQPDDAVPRFAYEDHLRDLLDKRIWPSSTRHISELRLTIEYESSSYLNRLLGSGRLHLDIVDYPGEWLLDLPLLGQDFATWSHRSLALSRSANRVDLAAPWHEHLKTLAPTAAEDENWTRRAAALFTEYLRACREDDRALSTLPPGRFLMPGDLQDSPALTFSPLDLPGEGRAPHGSLWAMMERRYEAYKAIVVKPFFRDHFARLDRQIVLVDALAALNAGSAAIGDLETALADILACFRPGRNSWLSAILARRIDRLLFAATKADHLHQDDHDRLQAILRRLLASALERAEFAGAAVEVLALASVRATREAVVKHDGEQLACIMGTPLPGETLNGRQFDGETEVAVFPGDLPDDPECLFPPGADHGIAASHGVAPASGAPGIPSRTPAAPAAAPTDLHFLRFRPPRLERTDSGIALSLPHIRLDRALEFLLGDRLA